MDDLISRQAAIDALWKALYEYEDKTENQFIESDELDVEDWVQHRIFVQNMNDIDRQTILEIPSAQQWIPCSERLPEENGFYLCKTKDCKTILEFNMGNPHFNEYPSFVSDVLGRCNFYVVEWMPLP